METIKSSPNRFNEESGAMVKNVTVGVHRNHIISAALIMTNICHGVAHGSGWWHNIKTGEPKDRNVGEMLCLIHSEVSEAMEGARKDLADPHLPEYSNFEVELADAVIRIFDLAGGAGINLGEAIAAKLQYNCNRADHKPENRAKADGKQF